MESLESAMDAGALRAFWAHMSLRLVDWAIRHQTAESVDHYLAFASSRIGPSPVGTASVAGSRSPFCWIVCPPPG